MLAIYPDGYFLFRTHDSLEALDLDIKSPCLLFTTVSDTIFKERFRWSNPFKWRKTYKLHSIISGTDPELHESFVVIIYVTLLK